MPQRTGSRRIRYQTELRQAIRKFLPARGLPLLSADRRLRWTDRLLVLAAVLMVWALEPTLKDAFAVARSVVVALYPTRRRPGRAFVGFLKALATRSERLLATVGAALRRGVQRVAGRRWRWKGRVVMGVDGTRIDCPRTRANEQAFGCAGQSGTAPQMLLTTLFHVGTGLPWAWHRGPGGGSERHALEGLLALLPPRTLLLADAGYVGYAMLQTLIAAGHDFVMRVGRNVRLLKQLGFTVREYDGVVYLWPQRHRQEPPLVLRLVTVRGRGRPVALLTNVLDLRRLSDRHVADLYRQRWGIEVLYRSLKQTLRRRKMLGQRPDHASLELDWAMVGLGLLGLMTAEAGSRGGHPPQAWSPAQAQRVVRRAMQQIDRPRPAGGLRRQLRRAVKDTYCRRRPKTVRLWPRKKTEPPPGLPRVRMAMPQEIRLAQAFHAQTTTN